MFKLLKTCFYGIFNFLYLLGCLIMKTVNLAFCSVTPMIYVVFSVTKINNKGGSVSKNLMISTAISLEIILPILSTASLRKSVLFAFKFCSFLSHVLCIFFFMATVFCLDLIVPYHIIETLGNIGSVGMTLE